MTTLLLPSMRAIKLGLAFALFALVSLGLFVSTVSAATINVPADQPTIAAAVAAAIAGDVIEVAPGTYPEGQIVISKNLTISGNALIKPVIQPALALPNDLAGGAWFLVTAGITFNIDNVVFDGSTNFIHQALRSHGNTTVDAVDFRNIRGSLSGSPYRGVAIQSYGGTVPGGAGNDSHGAGGAASHLIVTNSTFANIGRIGVLVKGTQSTADIECNTYTGKGNGDWLDYGFEAGAGGSITVTRNTVSGNTGVASDGSTSAGILVTTYWGPGTDALIQSNTLSGNTTGIAVGYDASDTSDVEAHNNNITGNITGVSSTSGPVVDATSNWWGDASGPGGVGPGTGDAVSADVLFGSWLTSPALGVTCGGAGGGALNSSFIKIEAKNSGSIDNTTSSKASTGSNTAEGSRGGRGGRGGDVSAEAEVENGDSHDDAKAIGNNGGATAGDGGDGGNGSFGGYVSTATSTAVATTDNSVNDSDIGIDIPVVINSTKLEVEVDNDNCKCNSLGNTTRARARTGHNEAKGSAGGDGGSGGEIEAEAETDGGGDAETTGNNGGAVAGNGGEGGTGDVSGVVWTGVADSVANTTNRMNTTRIRIN